MAEYIDRKQIRYTWWRKQDGTFSDGVTLQSVIDDMPTADVVPVVRCKDCKHCDHFYPECDKDGNLREAYYCKLIKGDVKPTDFCSNGKTVAAEKLVEGFAEGFQGLKNNPEIKKISEAINATMDGGKSG